MHASRITASTTDSQTDVLVAHAAVYHPLEMFPIFRRWKCGFWRDIVYTAIWNTLFALVFSAFWLVFDADVPVFKMLKVNFIIAQCIGYSIHLLFVVTDRLVPESPRRVFIVRVLYYAVVPIVGVYVGYWLASILLGWNDLRAMLMTVRGVLGIVMIAVIITGVLLAILIPRERAARAEAAMAREQARLAASERETTEARMQLLEAQVEPHFLYNTMAHVVSLIDTDPGSAKGMLERLIALLRSTAIAGNGGGTLQAQIDHLRAYLDLLALRMGPRLTWTIDVPPELARLPLPPMLLQPVVENAIKHGLEPNMEGGKVAVSARRDAGRLVLTIADTGMGFSERRNTNSTGLGLANLRARLAALYGNAASVTIEDNAPAGARVTIALPLPVATQ